jgi:prevent-host-death family protein
MSSSFDVKDIGPLTDFKRSTAKHLRRLKDTGRPQLLTINGRAELVVQDARSYQRLMEIVDRAEAIAGVIEGLEDVRAGRSAPVDEAFASVRREVKKRGRRR